MPEKHRYKCRNQNCTPPSGLNHTGLFAAMNSPTPACPACESIKVEDWGSTDRPMGWIKTQRAAPDAAWKAKNSDQNFRRIADRYGMTDMSNKDGKAVKAHKSDNSGPTVNLGGIPVPLSATGGACVNIPSMSQPIKQGSVARSKTDSNMLKSMTSVIAKHQ